MFQRMLLIAKSNKLNRAKALALAVTVAAGLVLTPASFADDDCSQDCEDVFQQAQDLPTANAKSIHDYLNRVVDSGMQYLQNGSDQILEQTPPDNGGSN